MQSNVPEKKKKRLLKNKHLYAKILMEKVRFQRCRFLIFKHQELLSANNRKKHQISKYGTDLNSN